MAKTKPTTTAKPSPVTQETAFKAVDLIDRARSDLAATINVLSELLFHDAEYNTPDLIGTMERHIRTDLAALAKAQAKAFDMVRS